MVHEISSLEELISSSTNVVNVDAKVIKFWQIWNIKTKKVNERQFFIKFYFPL